LTPPAARRDPADEVVNLQAAAGNTGLVDSLVRQAERRADNGAGPWQRSLLAAGVTEGEQHSGLADSARVAVALLIVLICCRSGAAGGRAGRAAGS
jgi:hypothetical protein